MGLIPHVMSPANTTDGIQFSSRRENSSLGIGYFETPWNLRNRWWSLNSLTRISLPIRFLRGITSLALHPFEGKKLWSQANFTPQSWITQQCRLYWLVAPQTRLPLSTVFSARSRQNKRENNLWTVTNIFTGLHISPLSTLIVIACGKLVSPVSSFLLYEECNIQTFRETKTVFIIYFKHFQNTTY